MTAPLGLAQAEITLISARGRFIDSSTDSQKGTQQAPSLNGLEKQCEWKQGSEIQRSKIMAAFQTAQVHDHGLTRTAGRWLPFFHPTARRTVLAVKGPLRRAKPARPGLLRAVLRIYRYERKGAADQRLQHLRLPLVGDARFWVGIFQPELTGRPWAILGAGIFNANRADFSTELTRNPSRRICSTFLLTRPAFSWKPDKMGKR